MGCEFKPSVLYGTSTICWTMLIDLRQTLLYSPSSAEWYAIQATRAAFEAYRTAIAVLSSCLHTCKSWIHVTSRPPATVFSILVAR